MTNKGKYANLPPQERAKAEAADRKIEELRQQQAAAAGNPPQNAPAAETTTPGGASSEPVPPVQPTEQPPQPKPEETLEHWRQKYLTLKGMYDAEVPRLHAELREARTHQQPTPPAAPAAPAAAPETEPAPITDDERKTYGEDVIKLMERIADAKQRGTQDQVKKLEAQLTEARKQREDEGAQQAHESFLANVRRLAPDFDALNSDPRFRGWLADRASSLGKVTRKELLDQAVAEKDADAVAAFFNEGKTAISTAAAPAAPVAPVAPPAAPRPSAQSLVMPKSSGGGGSIPQSPQKMWKGSEIKKFSDDISRGHYRGRPQERERIQNEIDAAMSEGRISPKE